MRSAQRIQRGNLKLPDEMRQLAAYIVDSKSGHFEPQKFVDHYEAALAAGTVELRIPELRKGSYFPGFLEPFTRGVSSSNRLGW